MRRTVLLIAIVVTVALTGCTTVYIPLPPRQVVTPEPVEAAPESRATPGIADCLDEMNGLDSDWTSLVPCTAPHLYDVVGIGEWPGMAEAIAQSDPGTVFSTIVAADSGELVDRYFSWADDFCSTALREAVGWSGPEIGNSFNALWVMPVGPWAVDRSLASRAAFVAGEHRTLCSLGWLESTREPAELTVRDVFSPDYPVEMRDCWIYGDDDTIEFSWCDEPHTDQTILSFDARAAFGIDFVKPMDQLSDADWQTASGVCDGLVSEVALGFDRSTMYAWASIFDDSPEWEALDRYPPIDGARYFMSCLVSRNDNGLMRGDVMTGAVDLLGGAPGRESA
ncbi:hypothetical protein [Protaetiibacter larvae]|uniref:Septum formation-related domain-containing protein n=1 Tax=Protaetiibacter larvae TaxID=2592654 RepID=A0A5C1Y9J8_9MICO|nr:hypothetical protein [Protaetiibacter larvae]QEO09819.1 hypothetical protein FLP23_07250 [Protaetiibacter larvae]